MNFKTESIRLAGSRKMDIPSLARDIEMALENAVAEAVVVIKEMERLSRQRIGLRLPIDERAVQINKIANEYLGDK